MTIIKITGIDASEYAPVEACQFLNGVCVQISSEEELNNVRKFNKRIPNIANCDETYSFGFGFIAFKFL